MIDYERYDHTYCRLSKDGDETRSRKRTSSSASYEGVQEVELNDHQSAQVVVDKENGTRLNHEPVIIVRTKRPRKTAPIIVKTINTEGDAVLVSTVSASTSLVAKRTLAHPIVQRPSDEESPTDMTDGDEDDGEIKEAASSDSVKVDTAADEETKEIVPEVVPEVIPEVIPEVVQTTKSGRTRKLTAKAKENSENSKKAVKAPKREKVKAAASNGESKVKKGRGRPRKDKVTVVKTGSRDSLERVVSEEKSGPKPEQPEEPHPSMVVKDGVPHTQTSSSSSTTTNITPSNSTTTAVNSESSTQSKKCTKPSVAETNNYTRKKAVSQKKSPNKKLKTKAKATSKKSPKRTGGSKLVVVTKPPPSKRRQNAAQTQSEMTKPVPAAKIDSSNIVRGRRRRR